MERNSQGAPVKGLFIALFDWNTAELYVENGVYGPHLRPMKDGKVHWIHYAQLADMGACREGDHVFFFLQRTIIYGGQITGTAKHGSFYINGPDSPLSLAHGATEYAWDESVRDCYEATEKSGWFERPADETVKPWSQPYLMRFSDRLGLAGQSIRSDELYHELAKYRFPLPSNAMAGMTFCVMTPGEAETAVHLLKNRGKPAEFTASTGPTPALNPRRLVAYDPKHGLNDLASCRSEAEVEASIVANPSLLPRLHERSAVLRQVPICPFRAFDLDRADVCSYRSGREDWMLPDYVLELKKDPLREAVYHQVGKYQDAMDRWLNPGSYGLGVMGRGTNNDAHPPPSMEDRVDVFSFAETKHAVVVHEANQAAHKSQR